MSEPRSTNSTNRTLARHPRPLGGDPIKRMDAPILSLSDRVLNNSGGKSHLGAKRKPAWLRAKLPGGPGYTQLRAILSQHKLHTVCEEAGCPNMGECWARGVATIMILGDTCTRSCGFCNVKTGKPMPADEHEPARVAESLALMGLKHVVITSVDRDDMRDGGAAIWAETIRKSRAACPNMSIEVLIPDFQGDWDALRVVMDARPEILNHNLETVRRMYPAVRPQAKFDRSIELLRICKDAGLVTKTGIMVGIGEKDSEVVALMREVRERAETDILTIGQYLQPTPNHLPIHRWVTPEQFAEFREIGMGLGFRVVESGPMVRSSYHADEQADALTDIQRDTHARMGALIEGAKKSAE
ncbi:MAG: lipoyl synthase [Phycisphaerales bacterium]|nr:lipoyl synthase [Phycisphaerales bacterium]